MSVRVRLYHGESGDAIGAAGVESLRIVEVGYDLHGSARARIELAPCAQMARLERHAPGGLGAFLAVESEDLGLPMRWLGVIARSGRGEAGRGRVLEADGPARYLDEVATGPVAESRRPAAEILRAVLESLPGESWMAGVTQGRGGRGRAGLHERGATSLWALARDLAEARLEAFEVRPRDAGVRADLHWMGLDGGLDLSGRLTLREGENCRALPAAMGLRPARGGALVLGRSHGLGAELLASRAVVPDGARPLGWEAALGMALGSRPLRRLGGDLAEVAAVDLEAPDRAALDAVARARLRRARLPRLLQQLEVTDCGLWADLRPHNRVRVQMAGEGGVFEDAVARLRTLQLRLLPEPACTLSVDLWRQLG